MSPAAVSASTAAAARRAIGPTSPTVSASPLRLELVRKVLVEARRGGDDRRRPGHLRPGRIRRVAERAMPPAPAPGTFRRTRSTRGRIRRRCRARERPCRPRPASSTSALPTPPWSALSTRRPPLGRSSIPAWSSGSVPSPAPVSLARAGRHHQQRLRRHTAANRESSPGNHRTTTVCTSGWHAHRHARHGAIDHPRLRPGPRRRGGDHRRRPIRRPPRHHHRRRQRAARTDHPQRARHARPARDRRARPLRLRSAARRTHPLRAVRPRRVGARRRRSPRAHDARSTGPMPSRSSSTPAGRPRGSGSCRSGR